MTATSWGFIHGSSCGNGARAKSARRRGPAMPAHITSSLPNNRLLKMIDSYQGIASAMPYLRGISSPAGGVDHEGFSLASHKYDGPDFSGPRMGTYSTLRPFDYRPPRFSVKLLFVGKLSLLSLPTEPAPRRPGVDPTGFEPASATVAGCCVPVTPRARREFIHVREK
jgi:hypothetical protein